MQRRFFAWLVGLSAWLALASPSSAVAQETQRVVVLEFQGRGAPAVRGHVLKALGKRSDVEVVSLKEAESARQRLRVTWNGADAYQKVGAELGVSAFVEGNVQKAGKRWRANVRVRDASTGLVAQEEAWTRTSLPQLKAVEGNFWQALGPAIKGSSVPLGAKPRSSSTGKSKPTAEQAAPTPEEDEEEPSPSALEDEDEGQAEREDKKAQRVSAEPEIPYKPEQPRMHPALIAWAGPRLMWRDLSYDDAGGDLSTYKNTAGSPAVNLALGAQWFPGAHSRGDWLADIGLEADVDYSLGLKSRQAGKEVKTTAYEISAGALYRLPLDSFEPRFRIGYVRHVFDADVPESTAFPGVTYSALRFGLGTAIFLVDSFSLDVNAAYLYVLDAGEIGEGTYAPDLSTRAFEFGGGVIGYIKEVYGIRAGADFRRYVYDFGKSGGTYALPEGGSDHYLRVTLAFVYRLAGKPKQR